MIANTYEKTYVCVRKSEKATEKLDDVVAFLRRADHPMTCKEIGIAVFGEKYASNYGSHPYAARLGQMLRHLREGGFVKYAEADGEPVQVTNMEYVRVDENDNTATIRVHDDEGNTYEIPNPKYTYGRTRGRWVEVTKTITPKIKVWSWVAE